ncbi:MAG: hypothetical protein NVSMB45_15060 [Ginsengibacter sp.]
MTHGSLFSGIGGFDLAAEWMGWDNKFHCEWNEFGQKVLKYYWPEAESFSDITKTDFTKYANRIDVLTGGFPCQPFSLAGEGKGIDDDRFLWPEMLRTIREIQPKWIVGENVYGIISNGGGVVFRQIKSDLEIEGYKIIPTIIPACAVNAEHERKRVWFIAHSRSKRLERFNTKWENLRLYKRAAPAIISYRNVFERGNGSRYDSEYLRSSNGVPSGLHKESIKSLGNAIVPQVAYQIFKTIEQFENNLREL